MSQAQSGARTGAPLGVQAAAAATNNGGNGRPAGTPPPPPAATAAPSTPGTSGASGTSDADGEKRTGSKVFIVEGKVHEFDSLVQAEKFLNTQGAPTQYSVLRGKQMQTKQKVSLR